MYVNRNWPNHGVEDVPKSGKPRAVPMWDQAASVLDTLSRREHFTDDNDFGVRHPIGRRSTTTRPRGRSAAPGRCGADLRPRPHERNLTFHDLRHSYGTMAASIYGNLREVQEYLGHASVTTTEIYAHHVPLWMRGSARHRWARGDAGRTPDSNPASKGMPPDMPRTTEFEA